MNVLKSRTWAVPILRGCGFIAALLATVASEQFAAAATYTVVTQPGWNLIANQLDQPNGNTIGNVISTPTPPAGSQLKKFNLSTKTFGPTETYTVGAGWSPGTTVLNPGDGLYFFNNSGSTYTITFSGNLHLPVLPITTGAGAVLVARQTNAIANATNILGYPPTNGTVLYRFNPAAGRDPDVFSTVNYTIHSVAGNVWTAPNGVPNAIRVGEAVWINTNGQPIVVTPPQSQTVCSNSPVTFSVTPGGAPPFTYQWRLGTGNIPNANSNKYTINAAGSSDLGNYTVIVSNSVGSVTSQVATLSFGFPNPPTVNCPADQTLTATSPSGAQAFFTATAFDACQGPLTPTCDHQSGSVFPIGITFVNCEATDSSQKRGTCTFKVTVTDPPCCDSKDWSLIDRTGPGPRTGHVMAYDANRGRTVLFGGSDGTNLRGDTWEFDGTNWQLISTQSAPSPRALSAMAYDVGRGRVVLFGGSDSTGLKGDTWEWNGAVWTPVNGATGPSPRMGHAMATIGNRIVLFGGHNTADLNDTWEYDSGAWSPKNPTAKPPARSGHAMASFNMNNRVVLFGGLSSGVAGAPGGPLDDTWTWDGGTWAQLSGAGPSARSRHAMAYDSNCDKVFLHGGLSTGPLGDTWQWDGSSWQTTPSSLTPATRFGHAMAYDRNNGKVYLYGGSRSQGTLSDMWELHEGGGSQEPLTVRSVDADCGDNKITVVFNHPLSYGSLDPQNYLVTCGPISMQVTQVQFGSDTRTVCVFVNQAIPTGQTCSIRISGVRDLCGGRVEGQTFTFTCSGCPVGSTGTDFWLTFPSNYAPDLANPPMLRLFITGTPGITGQVEGPGLIPPFLQNYTIPANGVTNVTVPSQADLGDTNDVVQRKGIHVTASQSVSVYGLNHVSDSSDAFMALPVKTLGKVYLVLSYQNVFNGIPELNGNEFAVVATENNTKVIIVPSVTAAGHSNGVPFSMILQQGEAYQLRATNNTPNDLSGSIVVGNKPIAVFGAHRCANIPSTNVFFCNHLVEQIPPTTLWGNDFMTVPLATRSGDTFRFMALQNSTTVRTNGVIVNGVAINQGGWHEVQLYGATRVTSDKPVLVAQFSNSADYDHAQGMEFVDPFMVLIPPVTLYGSDYRVQAPTSVFTNNFINLMVPNAAVGVVQLDGVAIPGASFAPIPTSGYSEAQVHVSTGPHRITSSAGPVGAIVYGFSYVDGYGYPAGLCGSRGSTQQPPFQCPTNYVEGNLGTNCTVPVPDYTHPNSGGNILVVDQSPPPGTQVPGGTTHITLIATDYLGNSHTCLVDFVVFGGPNIFCPTRIETNCVNGQGVYVDYKIGKCDENFQVSCDHPPGVFPVGTTMVKCDVIDPATGLKNSCTFPVVVRCNDLKIRRNGNEVIVTFAGGTLYMADQVNAPRSSWLPVDATSEFRMTIDAQNPRKFFKLVPDP